MAPLLERLESTIPPKTVDAIGAALGIDGPLAQKGLRVVGPTLLGVMAKTASTPEGAASIMGRLGHAADPGDLLGRAMKTLSGGGSGEMMGNVLGSGTNAICSTLSRSLGFDVTPLFGLGATIFTGVLANLAKSRNLDAPGVAAMLENETTEFLSDPASKGVARVVQSALAAGDAAAAMRKAFTDVDWAKIRAAPIAVGGGAPVSSRELKQGFAHEAPPRRFATTFRTALLRVASLSTVAISFPGFVRICWLPLRNRAGRRRS